MVVKKNRTQKKRIYGKLKKICKQCNKEFEVYHCEVDRIFCSVDCTKEYKKGIDLVCPICGKTFYRGKAAISDNNFCSRKCKGVWLSTQVGELGINWRGGISTEHDKIRKMEGIKEWRLAVFSRDRYTCQHCGVVGATLNAHHIKRFRDYPELRVDVDNGITLCVDCHKIETRRELLEDGDFHERMTIAKQAKRKSKDERIQD